MPLKRRRICKNLPTSDSPTHNIKLSVSQGRQAGRLALIILSSICLSFTLGSHILTLECQENIQFSNQNLRQTIALNSHGQPYLNEALNLLTRLRRQTNQAGQQANQAAGQSEAASSQNGAGSSGDPNANDQSEAPEVLPSLKCDFGSADVPDLCKFKILDADTSKNPLSRAASLAAWTLGSGKLALFQGGPLIDATGLQANANDTDGGYIFYETSNPFTGGLANLSSVSTHMMDSHGSHKPPSSSNQYNNIHDQLISSQRVSVAPASMTNALQQQQQQQMHMLSTTQMMSSWPGPSFMSPNLTAPGPSGMCLSFQYAISGLSAEELRIYLSDQKTGRSRQIWSSSESAASNWTKGEVLYSVTNLHSLVFSAISSNAIIKDLQQRKFRGHLALDEIDIQKHDPVGGENCKGHCNFDGDLCGWTNGENGQEDDFDWSFGRGSDNLFTGPARDFTSSSNNELTGSFLFTNSGYPRRPGDRALLLSPMFQPTAVNDAMCMRFAVHMFGSGIGSLAIKIRYADEGASQTDPNPSAGGVSPINGSGQQSSAASGQSSTSPKASQVSPAFRSASSGGNADGKPNDLVVWEMSGDAGNSWHQAQTSVSSSRSPFQVVIEGVIGENHLGNIALDEISFSQGPCPTSPPVASKNYGDCTFEQSMCYWRNPDADIHLDDLDWIRTADETSIHGPNFDHTLKKRSGSYLKLENTFREPKSGTRAFLLSPVFQPKASGSVQCLSFYYYMFMRSISSSGPNLGTIRVYLASNNELVPIWRLTNPISSPNWKHGRASLSTSIVDGQPQAPTKLFQIAFEGIWGDAASGAIALDDITVFDGACDLMPAEARSVPGECTFDVDMCSWSNKSASFEMSSTGQLMPMSTGSISMMMFNNNEDPSMLDSSRSPFLQSVGTNSPSMTSSRLTSSGGGYGSSSIGFSGKIKAAMGWQLATVDSRPVNLQDHTYKAPIGYAYVDVLESSSRGTSTPAYPLQSAEVTVQSGQQLVQCLSFWFAAYGRQELNQLSVYLTQASVPPPPPEEGGPSVPSVNVGGRTTASGQPLSGASTSTSTDTTATEAEQANAWKLINGKRLWNVALKNVTESHRRKWLYGQVTIRADSNHIVRFLAISNDGGFALDDVSYFEGACETRPAHARVLSAEEEAAELAAAGAISNTGGTGANNASSGSGSVLGTSGGGASSGGATAASGSNGASASVG